MKRCTKCGKAKTEGSFHRIRKGKPQRRAACGDCRKPIDLDGQPGSWGLDHAHSHCPGTHGCTKCIRGILCRGCNTALGYLGDDGDRMRGLVVYLKRANPRIGANRSVTGGLKGADPARLRAPLAFATGK